LVFDMEYPIFHESAAVRRQTPRLDTTGGAPRT
jgi:hypothetical protein